MRQPPNTPYINLDFHLGFYSNPKSDPWVSIVVLMRQQPNTPYINLDFHLGLLDGKRWCNVASEVTPTTSPTHK